LKTAIRMAAAAACWLLLPGCGGEGDKGKAEPVVDEATLAVMRGFVEKLTVVLPKTVDRSTFRDPEEQPVIRGALAALAYDASLLAEHSRSYESGVVRLQRSLERDTSEILRQYERGHYDRAAFLLRNVTENCVVCHVRLPSPGDSPLAEHFIDRTALTRLPAPARATLQMATRRFDDALTTLEGILSAEELHPALVLGPLTDYLTLCIRVKSDCDRPIPTLEKFARRPDLWLRLRLDVEEWIAALPALRKRVQGEPDLASARTLVTEGIARCDLRDPRLGVPHLIAASAILQRVINEGPQTAAQLAEAYYLLGETESRIGRNYWVTEAPFFFETSIRVDPGSPFAEDAYSLLEEEILMSYEGSDWDEIQGEDRALLSELRTLMDGAGR